MWCARYLFVFHRPYVVIVALAVSGFFAFFVNAYYYQKNVAALQVRLNRELCGITFLLDILIRRFRRRRKEISPSFSVQLASKRILGLTLRRLVRN